MLSSVSIHAPARGATGRGLTRTAIAMFQSTHPHGVRHVASGVSMPLGVSIHAPARGATMSVDSSGSALMFQSTHPHGVRLGSAGRETMLTSVSIHAPARGATVNAAYQVQHHGFNPRTRTGCDVRNMTKNHKLAFQSTHPHGVRLKNWESVVNFFKFQSTHPHGVRLQPSAEEVQTL